MPASRSHHLALAAVVVPVLVALLAAAGCSSGSSPSASGSTTTAASTKNVGATTAAPGPSGAKTACELVTEVDATAALGSPAGTGVATLTNGSSRCVYGDGALDVYLSPSGKAVFDQGHKAVESAPAGTWSDLPDLGDAAFTSHGGPVVSVEVLAGQTLISVILSGSTAPVPTDAAVALTRSAVARL